MANYKIMPNNLDAEQAVLGCLLIDNECQTELMYQVKAEDFYTEAHKNIFEAMTKVFYRNVPIDFITLTEELEREGKINAIGGLDYITFLSNVVPSAANYKYYADIVKATHFADNLFKADKRLSKNLIVMKTEMKSWRLPKAKFLELVKKKKALLLSKLVFQMVQ